MKEASQQEVIYFMIPFTGNIQGRQIHRTESRLAVAMSREEVRMEFLFETMKIFWKEIMAKTTVLHPLKMIKMVNFGVCDFYFDCKISL